MAAFHSLAGTVRMMLLDSTVGAAGRRPHVTGVAYGNWKEKGDMWVGEGDVVAREIQAGGNFVEGMTRDCADDRGLVD